MTTNPFYAQQPTVFTGLNQGSATGPNSDGLGTPTTSSPAGIGLGLANGLSMMGPVGFLTTLMAHPKTPFEFIQDMFNQTQNAPISLNAVDLSIPETPQFEAPISDDSHDSPEANMTAGSDATVGGGISAADAASAGAGVSSGDSATIYKGGPVTHHRLIGDDPPGPDDGWAALDEGEYVLRAAAAKRLGPAVLKKLNSGKVSGKDLAKALMK